MGCHVRRQRGGLSTVLSDTERLLLRLLSFKPLVEKPAVVENQQIWDGLMSLGEAQGLIPLLYWQVRQQGLENRLPTGVRERLYFGYQKNVARATLLLRELRSILGALADVGITAVLLKGAITLVVPIYPCFACRWMSDLDLLIKKEQSERAKGILGQMGYRLQLPEGQDCLTYRRNNGIGDIELHFTPLKAQYHCLVDVCSFWAEAEEVEIGGIRTLVPSPEDQIWHRIVHDLLVHANFTICPAATLYELCRIITYYQGRIDWENLNWRAKKHHLSQTLSFLLFLVHQDLGLASPKWRGFSRLAHPERWRDWIWDRKRAFPRSFIYARNRFNTILMSDGDIWGKFKATYRTIILNSAFREPQGFLLRIYQVDRYPFLTPLIRLLHCIKMLAMHMIMMVTYLRFRAKADG